MSPTEFFCRIYKPIEYTEVKQDARAIGLYPNGNSEVVYPIYGSLDFDRENTPDEFDENYDMIPEESRFKEYFEGYGETLAGIGVNVLDMGFIKRSGIQEILDQIGTGEITIPTYIPGGEKANPSEPDWEDGFYPDYGTQFFFKVNIKDHLPSEYQWLIGTSFWTGSATYYLDEEFSEEYYYDEFLTTVGDYCSYDRGCIIPMIGIGLRPVVNIPASDISINTEKNPNTADDIASYLAIGVLSLAGIISCGLYINRHLTHSL